MLPSKSIHTRNGGVIGRSRERRRRRRRVLCAAVQQFQKLQGTGKLPASVTEQNKR